MEVVALYFNGIFIAFLLVDCFSSIYVLKLFLYLLYITRYFKGSIHHSYHMKEAPKSVHDLVDGWKFIFLLVPYVYFTICKQTCMYIQKKYK